VANILKETQATPDSILVLTFTDSAARTVAKRLVGLIGEEAARKVGAYTFHSFAQSLMTEYPEAFPEYTDRRLMGEVEQVLLWREVLESRPITHVATPKSPFHYVNDLRHLEEDLTRECISLSEYGTWLDEEAKRIEADPSHRYVRGEKAGEMKQSGLDRLERLLKGREAIELIEAYRELKDTRGLYGYTDVLRIAVDALGKDEALRAELQERYQYVLADEHQDANALQHALLDALAYDDYPNLFIVGDEKQAIFGFQGADTTHFGTFLEQYPRTETIALTENYRSYQEILDLSHGLLKDLPSSTGAHVELAAFRGAGAQMHVLPAPDPLAERDQVATLVEEAIREGVEPHEIAIITMKNRTADLFALHLRARGIPALRAGDIDLEGRPAVRYLLALAQAVADPNDTASLRSCLLAPWWQASLAERAAFLRQYRDFELTDALMGTFPDIGKAIAELRELVPVVPPVNLFSTLLKETGARAFFLGSAEGVSEDLPLVRQLIMHIEELAARSPNATFGELMETFEKAREHEIGSIKSTLTQREGQVTVITAHKAKGMEFKRVFVASLTAGEWESRGRSALIPSPFDSKREHEEVIRLFYVALTRAKDELVLSYPVANAEGKETKLLSLLPSGLPSIEVTIDPLPLLHASIDTPLLVQELTLRYLEHDGLSPSAYNEYLESPATFFAKRVLRLREPETRAIVVGNAVHAAIAAYLRADSATHDEREATAHAELARSLKRSLLPRGDAFDALTRHARNCLDSYLGSELLTREPVAVEESFSMTRTVNGKEILLKGKVDAVFKGEGGECIVDFKTSSSVTGKKEAFERQLAFYDLVLRANGHETTSALIVQVGEEEVTEHPVALTNETRAELEATLAEVLDELISGKWREGTPSDYDDLLQLFA
jgi:DNA helicase-2/ATP-dependent DNA helicase PcrA